jgi:hypothetical protein
MCGKLVTVLVPRNGVDFCRKRPQILLALDVGADCEAQNDEPCISVAERVHGGRDVSAPVFILL